MFEDVERGITEQIALAIEAASDPASGLEIGLATFLDVCERPDVVRLVLTDAPAVLGWAEWRSIEARHGLGLIRAALQRAAHAGLLVPAPIAHSSATRALPGPCGVDGRTACCETSSALGPGARSKAPIARRLGPVVLRGLRMVAHARSSRQTGAAHALCGPGEMKRASPT